MISYCYRFLSFFLFPSASNLVKVRRKNCTAIRDLVQFRVRYDSNLDETEFERLAFIHSTEWTTKLHPQSFLSIVGILFLCTSQSDKWKGGYVRLWHATLPIDDIQSCRCAVDVQWRMNSRHLNTNKIPVCFLHRPGLATADRVTLLFSSRFASEIVSRFFQDNRWIPHSGKERFQLGDSS